MFNIIKKELNVSIVSSLIYIIIGLIIIFNPETTLKTMSTMVALLAIIYGTIMTVINIVEIKKEGNLVFGILLLVMGITLLLYPSNLNILISLGVGTWFISSSVSRIKFAILLKDAKGVNWLVILVMAILTLIVGITFIFTPLSSAITLATTIGILMIVYSACDIIEILFIKKNIKAIQKALK